MRYPNQEIKSGGKSFGSGIIWQMHIEKKNLVTYFQSTMQFQRKILKTWVITFEDVSKQKFEEIISGNIIPRPHTVDDPGLTEFKAGDKISQQEYDNNKEYGLTIR